MLFRCEQAAQSIGDPHVSVLNRHPGRSDLLRCLSAFLSDEVAQSILRELMQIQCIAEQDLLLDRKKFLKSSEDVMLALVSRHKTEYGQAMEEAGLTEKDDVELTTKCGWATKRMLDTLTHRHKSEVAAMRSTLVDKLEILDRKTREEFDKHRLEQQETLILAGMPGFTRTTSNPEDIRVQMAILALCCHLFATDHSRKSQEAEAPHCS